MMCSRCPPANAIGTEPSTIHPTRPLLTVPLRRCTPAPTGRMTTAATRSLEIAADGVTPNSRISIGVISAPPPAPVTPTRNPTMALPRTMYGSICTAFPLPQATTPRYPTLRWTDGGEGGCYWLGAVVSPMLLGDVVMIRPTN